MSGTRGGGNRTPAKRGPGRPKGTVDPKRLALLSDIKSLILPELPALVARLIAIANSDDHKTACSAIGMLMDRALGRPVQQIATPENQPLEIKFTWGAAQ